METELADLVSFACRNELYVGGQTEGRKDKRPQVTSEVTINLENGFNAFESYGSFMQQTDRRTNYVVNYSERPAFSLGITPTLLVTLVTLSIVAYRKRRRNMDLLCTGMFYLPTVRSLI